MDYKVHVGFGFHVNCYHSYRGDTNDSLGFGGDIRIMRHIIKTLDDWNAKGVPVKGTWDFENAYSLEEILPKYAPDIIEDVKRRQNENGDENILMGYNNGAMSAMTEEEFMASVQLAITNDKKSGLDDIFGSCEKIIRPQEVMFTPSQAGLYKKAGVEAVCLYYSCIPFDAFRTIIPQLSDEDAFNPLTYTYEGESITILPTYSNSDIMDAGSLRWWVSDLHEKQLKGEIKKDVFVFINIDADSFLWEPMPVPGFLKKLPNFNGIGGLVEEISDLSFVEFNTPGGYLKNHKPEIEITFGEDVADGNFSGYASWSEKPFNRQIWSRLERARMYAAHNEEKAEGAGFNERVRLLSTTHFGLASPVMNIVREQKALGLSEAMVNKDGIGNEKTTDTNADTIMKLCAPKGSDLISVQLELEQGFCKNITELKISASNLNTYTVIPMENWEDESVKLIYLVARMSEVAEEYELHFETGFGEREPRYVSGMLTSGNCTVKISEQSGFPEIYENGTLVATWDSWIDYDGKKVQFDRPAVSDLTLGGSGEGLHLAGEIHLPDELEPGYYTFDFIQSDAVDGIILQSNVNYPYTFENHEISSQASNLGRYSDVKWRQAVPMELSLILQDDAKVVKRNFMDSISEYPISDFWRSFAENKNISSFNHQLTGGLLSVEDSEKGLVLAHARQVLGSMAHCPMRLETTEAGRKVSMNPFGHYFGEQRYYPTRGNGCVMGLYNATMPQARSIAPAYNGAKEQGIQLIQMSKAGHDKTKRADILAFADGAVRTLEQGKVHVYTGDNVMLHEAKKKTEDVNQLKAVASDGASISSLLGMVVKYIKNMRYAKKQEKRVLKIIQK